MRVVHVRNNNNNNNHISTLMIFCIQYFLKIWLRISRDLSLRLRFFLNWLQLCMLSCKIITLSCRMNEDNMYLSARWFQSQACNDTQEDENHRHTQWGGKQYTFNAKKLLLKQNGKKRNSKKKVNHTFFHLHLHLNAVHWKVWLFYHSVKLPLILPVVSTWGGIAV